MENFANEFETTLTSGIDSTTTSVPVASVTGAPEAEFRIRIDNEYMVVTGVSGLTLTVLRGREGSANVSHSNGATVTHVLTASGLSEGIMRRAYGNFAARGQIYDDLFVATQYNGGVATNSSGTGSGLGANTPDLGHPGVLFCTPGTTATGRAGLWNSSNTVTMGLTTDMWFGIICRPLSGNLSNGTDRYTVRMGWSDSITADPVDGVYFRYSDNLSAGNWEGVTRSNSTESVLDTGSPVDTLWHTFEIKTRLNYAEFYIDGVSKGTLTTNVPNGTARVTTIMPFNIIKSLGTTRRDWVLDAYWYVYEFDQPDRL